MPETTSRLRCVTLNVLGPANPDWERRSLIIKEVLDRLGADVVALQEVRAADAEHLLGSGYQVTPFSETSEDGTGGVLATRAPHDVLEEIDQRTAEHGQDLPWCATLVVTLDSPVGRLVVAHHKPNWPFPLEVEREQQARRAALAVERHAGDGPAVVLGDFDATPDAGSMSFWRGRRSLDGVSVCFQDAWETARPGEAGFTFSDENPLVRAGEVATAVSRRIDYVLVRAGRHGALLQVLRCDRLLDRPVRGCGPATTTAWSPTSLFPSTRRAPGAKRRRERPASRTTPSPPAHCRGVRGTRDHQREAFCASWGSGAHGPSSVPA